MSDLFLVLAQLEEGVSCFVVPRVLPDGSRNVFHVQRLKDKLGDRSNASSEVEFDGTTGWLVGEPGRGVPAIIEMVNMTRLDCVLGSAATVRAALTQAIHHARHRRAFGALLVDQPLMQNVLADLAVESEAATALAIRLAAAVDAGESAFLRLAGAAAKFWVCKRTPGVVAEAMEVLGGNGYVEESGLPRLYRQAPLNSIWEGSGNVIALDVLRAMGRSSDTLAAVTAEIELARGCRPPLRRRGQAAARRARRPRRSCPSGRGGSPVCWRCASRVRCCCGTRRRRSPTRSAPLAWAGTGAPCSARCRPAPPSTRSSNGLRSRLSERVRN